MEQILQSIELPSVGEPVLEFDPMRMDCVVSWRLLGRFAVAVDRRLFRSAGSAVVGSAGAESTGAGNSSGGAGRFGFTGGLGRIGVAGCLIAAAGSG